ncbi:MAG: CoA pyrophosphatase [Sphingomonadales bacterium]|nr:CoA pyrophosphatase [Sphingomonadales bacterium]
MILPKDILTLEKKLLDQFPLPKGVSAKITGDVALSGHVWQDEETDRRKAAVLIPLISRKNGITVLLTKRAAHLPSHAGQVAFPGGKVEAQDKDIIHTALREAEEEVGLHKTFVNILGILDNYQTGTGFDIAPVVGVVEEGFEIVADRQEVEDVFEVPLSFILNKQNHILKSMFYKGADRQFYAMEFEGHTIWGATAAILVNFCYVLMQYVDEDS